jgi:hypothetical protein
LATRGFRYARKQFKQCAFACAVVPDDAHGFTVMNIEADVVEGPVQAARRIAPDGQECVLLPQRVRLAQPLGADRQV